MKTEMKINASLLAVSAVSVFVSVIAILTANTAAKDMAVNRNAIYSERSENRIRYNAMKYDLAVYETQYDERIQLLFDITEITKEMNGHQLKMITEVAESQALCWQILSTK